MDIRLAYRYRVAEFSTRTELLTELPGLCRYRAFRYVRVPKHGTSALLDRLPTTTAVYITIMAIDHHITPSTAHRGPGSTASILTWFLTVTVLLSVIARLGFRFSKLKLRARDDITLSLAAVW